MKHILNHILKTFCLVFLGISTSQSHDYEQEYLSKALNNIIENFNEAQISQPFNLLAPRKGLNANKLKMIGLQQEDFENVAHCSIFTIKKLEQVSLTTIKNTIFPTLKQKSISIAMIPAISSAAAKQMFKDWNQTKQNLESHPLETKQILPVSVFVKNSQYIQTIPEVPITLPLSAPMREDNMARTLPPHQVPYMSMSDLITKIKPIRVNDTISSNENISNKMKLKFIEPVTTNAIVPTLVKIPLSLYYNEKEDLYFYVSFSNVTT